MVTCIYAQPESDASLDKVEITNVGAIKSGCDELCFDLGFSLADDDLMDLFVDINIYYLASNYDYLGTYPVIVDPAYSDGRIIQIHNYQIPDFEVGSETVCLRINNFTPHSQHFIVVFEIQGSDEAQGSVIPDRISRNIWAILNPAWNINNPKSHILNNDYISNLAATMFDFSHFNNADNAYSLLFENDNYFDMDVHFKSFIAGNESINFNRSFFGIRENSTIHITNNAYVKIENYDIVGCQKLWNSIIVESGCTLELIGCTVQDGFHAISVEDGGKVIVRDNEFKNNLICVDITDPGSIAHKSVFHGNDFLGGPIKDKVPDPNDPPFPFPYTRSYIGVNIANQEFVSISGSINSDGYHNNHFENLDIGIKVYNSSAQLNYDSFKNCGIQGNQTTNNEILGAIISNNQSNIKHYLEVINPGNTIEGMRSCNTGIYAYKNNLYAQGIRMLDMKDGIVLAGGNSHSIYIFDNQISASNIGIQSLGYKNVNGVIKNNYIIADGDPLNSKGIYIQDYMPANAYTWYVHHNTFEVDKTRAAIESSGNMNARFTENEVQFVDENTAPRSGIRIISGEQLQSSCNNVVANNSNLTSNDDVGLNFENLQYTQISCNSISNIETNIRFDGNSMVELTANTIGNSSYGLLLGDPEVFDPYVAIGLQPHRGNIWNGTASLSNAYHSSQNTNVVDQSRFDVYYDSQTEFLWPYAPNSNDNPDLFVKVNNPTAHDVCEIDDCNNPVGSSLFFDDGNLTTQSDTIMGKELSFLSRSAMYRHRLLHNLSTVDMENSLNSDYMQALETINEVELDIASLFSILVNDPIQMLWNGYEHTNYEQVDEWDNQFRMLLYNDILNQQSNQGLNNSAILYQDAQKLNGISHPIVSQSSQYRYLNILIDYLQNGISNEFSVNNRTALRSLASSCSLTGGKYVTQAQNLFEYIYGDKLESTRNCGNVGIRSVEETKQADIPKLVIFPNPTQHSIELKGVQINEAEIKIYDARMLSLIKTLQGQDIIDVSELTKGIYIIQVTQASGQVSQAKFIKL